MGNKCFFEELYSRECVQAATLSCPLIQSTRSTLLVNNKRGHVHSQEPPRGGCRSASGCCKSLSDCCVLQWIATGLGRHWWYTHLPQKLRSQRAVPQNTIVGSVLWQWCSCCAMNKRKLPETIEESITCSHVQVWRAHLHTRDLPAALTSTPHTRLCRPVWHTNE